MRPGGTGKRALQAGLGCRGRYGSARFSVSPSIEEDLAGSLLLTRSGGMPGGGRRTLIFLPILRKLLARFGLSIGPSTTDRSRAGRFCGWLMAVGWRRERRQAYTGEAERCVSAHMAAHSLRRASCARRASRWRGRRIEALQGFNSRCPPQAQDPADPLFHTCTRLRRALHGP